MKIVNDFQGSNSNTYIRLKSGEFVQGVLRGDTYTFGQHKVGDKQFIKCEGIARNCPECKAGKKPAFRFRTNLVVNENNIFIAKILEGGWKLFEQLKNFADSGWELDKNAIRISRSGSTQFDTVYTATVLPNGKLIPAVEQKIAAVPLHTVVQTRQVTTEAENLEQADDLPEPGSDTDTSYAPF